MCQETAMSKKPLMLLMIPDSSDFRADLSRAGLADRFEIVDVKPDTKPSPAQLAEAEILLGFGAPAGMLSEMPRLRWLQAMMVGVDPWLVRKDLSPSVTLTAARGTHIPQMPENILGAIFHITKKYHQIALAQKESRWVRSMSTPVAGKTLGILGLGAIGQDLARRASALDMRVIGTKRTAGSFPHVDRVYAPEAIDEVLGQSDFVVLLMPSTPATENSINAARLAAMKKTAWLINFARGSLIVDADLIAAVKNGVIAGAILDVFRKEPLPADDPLWTAPGIYVLPHIGGGHPERNKMVASLFTENARRYLAGEPLREVVDRSRGY
jgi:glyoxylate/hydroxypyruvate reductase A